MKDLLPAGWKLWHPIVFAILFVIGARLADPLISFVLSIGRNVAS